VAELFLDGLEVGAASESQRRGAMAEVVQPYGWESGLADEVGESADQEVRVERVAHRVW
jgi:hypothetical protein